MNSYKQNKIIFNKIITQKYNIKKDPYKKNILYIYTNNKKIKCEYILFLIENKLDNKSDNKSYNKSIIIWSDSNPYIDNYTRNISFIIRNNLLKTKKYLINQNTQLILRNDLDNLVKDLIKNKIIFMYLNNKINCEWILINSINDIIEYYMIIDIIYY